MSNGQSGHGGECHYQDGVEQQTKLRVWLVFILGFALFAQLQQLLLFARRRLPLVRTLHHLLIQTVLGNHRHAIVRLAASCKKIWFSSQNKTLDLERWVIASECAPVTFVEVVRVEERDVFIVWGVHLWDEALELGCLLHLLLAHFVLQIDFTLVLTEICKNECYLSGYFQADWTYRGKRPPPRPCPRRPSCPAARHRCRCRPSGARPWYKNRSQICSLGAWPTRLCMRPIQAPRTSDSSVPCTDTREKHPVDYCHTFRKEKFGNKLPIWRRKERFKTPKKCAADKFGKHLSEDYLWRTVKQMHLNVVLHLFVVWRHSLDFKIFFFVI